jgi:hypothetical protein
LVEYRTFDPVDRCIYCGDRDSELTVEHIIPFGIGGRLQRLACAKITSGRESWYQNQTIGDFKTLLRFPARRGPVRRGTIRIGVKYAGVTRRVKVPAPQAPAYLLHPIFQEPELIRGAPWDTEPSILATVINPSAGKKLAEAHGTFTGQPIEFNAISFGLMLAIAVTPVETLARMTLPLAGLITNGTNTFPATFVGGARDAPEGRSPILHEIECHPAEIGGRELLVVQLRLFAGWAAPTYWVVAGMRDL